MSHYYGTIPQSGRKTTPTARGHKTTGLATIAASYKGAIKVELEHIDGVDTFTVTRIPWKGVGEREVLAEGQL
jgi:hypothetical protein